MTPDTPNTDESTGAEPAIDHESTTDDEPTDVPNANESTDDAADVREPNADDPIDWDAFWTDASEDRRRSAHVSEYGNPDLLERFFEETGVPDSLASVGCGPAPCPLELAERFPEMDVVGYDAAASAIEEAREGAAERGLENARFAVATLPDLDVDGTFDLVYCYATLHYVRDVERGLETLYDRVAEGGHLVCNYPTEATVSVHRNALDEDADGPTPDDPDAFRERFRLVVEEANLLAEDRIEAVLGTRPRDFWATVDAPNESWVGPHNRCVYVPK